MSTPILVDEPKDLAPLILSSDSFGRRERFDAWREELMLRVIRVDVDVPDKTNFRTRLRVLNLPNIAIIERRSTPSVVKRTRDLVRDGDDAFVFTLPWGGTVEIRAGADEARVGPGEAIITPLDEVGGLRTPLGVRGVSLRVARKAALSSAPGVERLVNRPVPVDEAAFAILSSYVVSLMSAPRGLDPSLASLADQQVRELLAHVFDPSGDLARAQTYGGIKAARLHAVIRDIGRSSRRARSQRSVGRAPASCVGAVCPAIVGRRRKVVLRLRARNAPETRASAVGRSADRPPAHRRHRRDGGLQRSFALQQNVPLVFRPNALRRPTRAMRARLERLSATIRRLRRVARSTTPASVRLSPDWVRSRPRRRAAA